MDDYIENEFLILEKLQPSNSQFIFDLLTSPGWLQNIGDRGIKTLEDAENCINERFNLHHETHGYGSLKIYSKKYKKAVGTCGLVYRDANDYPDLGYAILPEFYGNGLATQASKLVLENAKKHHFSTIWAFTNLDNIPSQKVLLKLGFKDMGAKYEEAFEDTLQKYELNL